MKIISFIFLLVSITFAQSSFIDSLSNRWKDTANDTATIVRAYASDSLLYRTCSDSTTFSTLYNSDSKYIFINQSFTFTKTDTIPAGVTLEFKPGIKITTTGGQLHIKGDIVDHGQQIFNSTDGSVYIYNQPINVLWFGADRTNTSDSRAAIQAAIDAADYMELSATYIKGSIIYVPKGIYKIDGTLNCDYGNLMLLGDPKTSVWDIALDWMFKEQSSQFNLTAESDTLLSFNYNAAKGIDGPAIVNMVFKDATDDTTGVCAVVIHGKTHSSFENCMFTGFMHGDGIRFDGAPYANVTGWIFNCMFAQNQNGIYSEYQTNNFEVKDCRFIHQTSKPYWSGSTGIRPDADWRITGNLFDQVDTCISTVRGYNQIINNSSDGVSQAVVLHGGGANTVALNHFGLTDTYGGMKTAVAAFDTNSSAGSNYVLFNMNNATTKYKFDSTITTSYNTFMGADAAGYIHFGSGENCIYNTSGQYVLKQTSVYPWINGINLHDSTYVEGNLEVLASDSGYIKFGGNNSTSYFLEFQQPSNTEFREFTRTTLFGNQYGYVDKKERYNNWYLYTGADTISEGYARSDLLAMSVSNAQLVTIPRTLSVSDSIYVDTLKVDGFATIDNVLISAGTATLSSISVSDSIYVDTLRVDGVAEVDKLIIGLAATEPALVRIDLYPTSADSMRFIITNPTAATKDTSAWIYLH